MRLVPLFAVIALALACDDAAPEAPPEPEPEPEPEPDPKLPCAEPGVLFGVDQAGETYELPDGAELPVTLGFQGFLFVQLGLRTSEPLAATIRLDTKLAVEGNAALEAPNPGVRTSEAPPGTFVTAPVLIFFLDQPLVELVGRTALVEGAANGATCRVHASASVTIVDGDRMDAGG